MTIEEILAAVRMHPAKHAVVTGGEPMISPDIIRLTERIRYLGLHVTIETAGTVYHPVACDLMSISPKLANSTPHQREGGKWAAQHERFRYQPDVLKKLMAEYDYQLKFVVASPDDLPEIARMLEEIDADRSRVVLMPEGATTDALRQRAPWLTEICKREGFRYSPRLHIDLWGNRRGV
jgi:7-carboxy-7-deazaguanine synthase